MLEENKKILDEVPFLNRRKAIKINSAYEKSKTKFFILSIFLCLVIINVIYFVSDESNIKDIIVEGNIYLKDEDIANISGLSTDDKYLLLSKKKVINNLKNNVLIKECNIEALDDLAIKITVQEKKAIGYAYEDDNNVLILEDDSRYVLNKDNLYLIEKVPLIEGFSKTDIQLIEKQLETVDYKMINEISEMHYYPALKYQSIEIIMRDGNYIFTSAYGLDLINKYYDMQSSVSSDKNNCYYFEDISSNAYMSACPWQETTEVVETNNEE